MGRKKKQSKHLIDLRPPKRTNKTFTGKAYMVDGMQNRYIKPRKISFWANLKYHLIINKKNKFPDDWDKVGDEDI